MTTPFSQEFRLSITKALGDQLADALSGLAPAPLTELTLEQVHQRSGVYQLFHVGELVYIGKAEDSLRSRLTQHRRKLSGRQGIDLSRLSFTCIYVAEDFSAVAPERLLIRRMKAKGGVPWNANGFGNKDPGRQRDRTAVKSNHFDVKHPIDLDLVIEVPEGPVTIAELLARLKVELPYNFRHQKPIPANIAGRVSTLPSSNMSADRIFRILSAELDSGWQIAALMGYVIMYNDGEIDYPSGWRYYRNGKVVAAEPRFEAAGEIDG